MELNDQKYLWLRPINLSLLARCINFAADHKKTPPGLHFRTIMKPQLEITLGGLNIRHSGLDPESRMYFWIPAFAGMTTPIYANIYATFRSTLKRLGGKTFVFSPCSPLYALRF